VSTCKKILVPTDGSTRSRKAARAAAWLARRLNASITALYVVPEGVPTAFSGGAIYGGGILGLRYGKPSCGSRARAIATSS